MPKKKNNNNLTNLGWGVAVVTGIVILWEALKFVLLIMGMPMYPLSCRGKVVDEKGAPVSGATVSYGVSQGYGQGSSGSKTTDEQGNFSVKGQRGGSMSVTSQHPGHVTTDASRTVIETKNSLFAQNVTLVFRKKLPEQNLIQRIEELWFQMSEGSGIVFYDLKSRTLVEAESPSTLRIRIQIGPNRGQTRVLNDWKLTADVPEGAVLLKTDPYLFEAPEAGFQDSFQVNNEVESNEWRELANPTLFVKLKTGEFGMVYFDFDSRDGTGRILSSSLNPEPGNRNLTPKFRR